MGSELAKAIRKAQPDWEIVGIDNFSRTGSWLNKAVVEKELQVQFFHGDIRCQNDVDALPACDWVIDGAANPSVLAGIDGKTSARQLIEHNLGGTINLLEYCKRHGAGFVLLSTSRVYSIAPLAGLEFAVEQGDGGGVFRNRYTPVAEQAFPSGITPNGVGECYSTLPPVSLYGSSKVTSEHLALEYGQCFDFPVWINRCGVMAGAGQFGHPAQGIFAFWIHAFREGKPLKYIGFDGHGRQVRDCLHPRDLWPLVAQQMQRGRGEIPVSDRICNVSGGLASSASLAELTHWCQRRFPASVTGEPGVAPEARRFDLAWVVLDNSMAKDLWNWQPLTSAQQVWEEIADFAEAHPDWLAVAK